MLYYNALLMLYRPSPGLSSASSRDSAVLQTIFVAAKKAITLYAHLHRSRRINYTWITLHSVFMAGLSLVYAVGRHFRSHKRSASNGNGNGSGAGGGGGVTLSILERDPTIIDIVNDSRACSNVLVAISERWNVSKSCHDVFNRLSDAIIADAVEYHTKASARNMQEGDASQIPLRGGDMDDSLRYWNMEGIGSVPLAVDSVLHECFDDLQRFQLNGCGDDPIGQLSNDWLGEIGGTGLEIGSMW